VTLTAELLRGDDCQIDQLLSFQDVTTIMGDRSEINKMSSGSVGFSTTTMTKKNLPKLTAEEIAERERRRQLLKARLAEREAIAREMEEARRRAAG
jgi:hypothetical protein